MWYCSTFYWWVPLTDVHSAAPSPPSSIPDELGNRLSSARMLPRLRQSPSMHKRWLTPSARRRRSKRATRQTPPMMSSLSRTAIQDLRRCRQRQQLSRKRSTATTIITGSGEMVIPSHRNAKCRSIRSSRNSYKSASLVVSVFASMHNPLESPSISLPYR